MAKKKEKDESSESKGGGKKGMLIPAIVLSVGMAAGGYFFMSGQSKSGEAAAAAAATTTTTIEHGSVIRLQPITMNLSDGHVLKVGMALQMVAKPEDEHLAAALAGGHGAKPDASSPLGGLEAKALDEAIATLGDSTYEDLSKPGGRAHVKEELTEKIKHIYHDDVIEVFFTDFVMS